MAKVFTDTFNRLDSNSLYYAPTYLWVDSEGDFRIVNYSAYAFGATSCAYDNITLDTADNQITITALYNAASGEGYLANFQLLLRASGTPIFDNCYFLNIQHYSDGTSGLSIKKRVGGVETTIGAEVKTNLTNGSSHVYKFIVINNWLTGFLDGVIKVYAADTSFTAQGYHGIRAATNNEIRDYQVRDVVDGKYAMIYYASGRPYSSSDFGKTWTFEDCLGVGPSGTNLYISQVGISHDGNVMAVSTNRTVSPINGHVYIKKDGYWADRSPTGAGQFHYTWNTVSVSADGTHILAGKRGGPSPYYLYISHNSGSTWTGVGVNIDLWYGSAINKDGTKFIAGQENGRLYYSSDGATITEVQPKGNVNGNWKAMDISFDGTRLLVADTGGHVYYSSNSGATWTDQNLNGGQNWQWQTVTMSDDGTYRLAAGSSGTLAWIYQNGAWGRYYPGGNNDGSFYGAGTNYYGTWSHTSYAHGTFGGTWYRNVPNFNLANSVADRPLIGYWYGFAMGRDDGTFPQTTNKTITAMARIRKYDVTKTSTARARVKYTGVAKTVDAKAKVQNPIYTGYSHFLNLTVDYTKVWNSTHTDFTVLVKTTQTFLKTVSNGGHVESTSGYDIIFGSTDGFTQYPHELIKYVPTTGECIFWVKLPSISNVANTNFRMWYGNPSIVTPTENKPNTWDTYHKAVYHLQETSGNAQDSTINANTMTASGGVTYSQPGKIGNSIQFNGTNALFYRNNVFGTGVDEVTVSGWMNATVFGSNPREVIHHGDNVSIGLELYTPGIITGQILNTTGSWKGLSQAGKSLNTWYRVSITGKQNNFINVYVDGVSIGAAVASNTWFDPGPNYSACFGAYKEVVLGELYHFNGKIEEVRYSNTVRSAGWIKTEYYNETDPAFITYSGEHISINVTVTARARIKKTQDKTVSAKARVKYTGVNTSVTAKANLAIGGTHIFGDEGLIY